MTLPMTGTMAIDMIVPVPAMISIAMTKVSPASPCAVDPFLSIIAAAPASSERLPARMWE